MDKLEAFLRPGKKKNIRFVLSEEFCGEDGEAAVWEMKILSARELCEIRRRYEARSDEDLTLALVAKSLVIPDMSDARLLEGLSEREGRTILDPTDALRTMLTAPQLYALVERYFKFQRVENFRELADEAKN